MYALNTFSPPIGHSIHNHDRDRRYGKRRNRFFWRPEGAPLFNNPF